MLYQSLSQSVPCPELAGYWQSWSLPGEEPLPLDCVPSGYTDVILAFAAPGEDGTLRFTGSQQPTRYEVSLLRSRGMRVLLSIGGGGVPVSLDTAEKTIRFSDSLYQLVHALGVDGIDIDVEQGMPAGASPLVPERAQLGLIQGLDRLLYRMPESFLLTIAPETVALVGGITRYGGAWGTYLPMILHYGDRISRVHMQYYNSGAMTGLSGQVYQPGTVDFVVAMAEAVIEGFPIADTGVRYPGFPPWKVAIGLPATPQAAQNGYLEPRQVYSAISMLRTGERGAGSAPGTPYRYLGGLMTWSIQWDSLQAYQFMENGRQILGIPC